MVPQVLQLNEMQPCWEERLPHCPRYPLPIHTHTHIHTYKPGLFSSYPHAVPAPTPLMFIHQPLKGQMQRPVKTKSDLFINDTGPSSLRSSGQSPVASWQPFWRSLDRYCPQTWLPEEGVGGGDCTGTAGEQESRGGGDRGATEKVRRKNFRRQGGMKREGGTGRERGLTFHADDWLPAIRAQSWSLIDRSEGRERVGNRVRDDGLERELHKTYSHTGGWGDAH